MRFFDKEAKAEAKTTAIHDDMVAKLVAKGLASAWQNEAASAQTTTGPVSARTSETRSWFATTAIEQPGLVDRPKRGRRAATFDAPPVRGPSGRPLYQPQRMFNIGGIFSANRPNAAGQVDRERWPSETGGSRNQSRPGRDGCPGCPQC